MNETAVEFKSGAIKLEGLLAIPEKGGPFAGAVVCHPHPLHGGSMDNNVVEAICQAMWREGVATLRFNFRGVGASEGEHGGGVAEREDVKAAIEFMAGRKEIIPGLVLAGYSFGARVALSITFEPSEVARIIAVALPVSAPIGPPPRAPWRQPIVLIAGDRDRFCAAPDIASFHAAISDRSRLIFIAGADHFFLGFETELAREIQNAVESA
ncbi:MAG: alpha/beta hydrolase [Candidatus Binataceae bacterium]